MLRPSRRHKSRRLTAHVDNLVEPRMEKIVLTAVPTLLRPHRESLPSPLTTAENHASKPNSICKIAVFSAAAQNSKIEYFKISATPRFQDVSDFFTDDY